MAPERPRRQPQVFPKSHSPQRRFAYFAAAGKVGRRPQTAKYSLKAESFAAAAASFFLNDQKETKELPGVGIFRKDLRLTPWSFRNPTPGPPVLRGSQRGAWAVTAGAETSGRVSNRYRCRSAQLTKQVLLQDNLRLSGATYTVGGGQQAATWGRPYKRIENLTRGRVGPPAPTEKRKYVGARCAPLHYI